MSFLRAPGGRSLRRKPTKPGKKTQPRQQWDSTVQDLSVHRATPEELVHRHEIHKSKNQWLAHWELQNKPLKKKHNLSSGGPDPLAERRYDIARKILCEQYSLKDILEDSDRALAVVKDLFGDAPRRRSGFPDVTLAPSCDLETSRGPIVQKKDPPTRLSILSQSTMDPQALNEVEKSFSFLVQSDEEQEAAESFYPRVRARRAGRVLNEEENPDLEFVTPAKADPLPPGQTALNATAAVKRVKTRLGEEEQEAGDSRSMTGQVLNPQPKASKKQSAKGKKKNPLDVNSSDNSERFVSGTPAPPRHSPSNLEILNHLTQEVEHELEEYEKLTGRAITPTQEPQGLTGFTMSLVNSLRRVVTYLKESDIQLRQEVLERRAMQRELKEQRALIDALTAEILMLKRGDADSETDLQPNFTETEDPLSVPAKAIKNHPVRDSDSESVHARSLHRGSGMKAAEFPGSAHEPICHAYVSPEKPGHEASLPAHVFQPAVMLSPPRQQSRQEFMNQSALFQKMTQAVPSSQTNMSASSSSEQDNPESHRLTSVKRLSPPCRDIQRLRTGEASGQTAGMWQTSRAPQKMDPLNGASPGQARVLPQPLSPSQADPPRLLQPAHREVQVRNPVTEGDGGRGVSPQDIESRMAQLAQENSALKSYLRQINRSTETLHPQAGHEDNSREPQRPRDTKILQGSEADSAPVSLEMRIAELNRQSAEAREKLLGLIERQKQSSVVSPAISPITPQSDAGSGGRKLEVPVPMLHLNESPLSETPSPAGSVSRRSLSDRTARTLNTSGGGRPQTFGQRTKAGREKDEGWFALSAHVS
ncbi:spindle and centriole-associated protein 1 [Spea bombifrons]|uniref:spindle and centriole-associated protein 1 n=1 Tax=Spea bombifrons TaxID=233779 RepID=UPI00234BD5CC|nr:spindle and centriole-associated protein 1 [Spea bombifrons]